MLYVLPNKHDKEGVFLILRFHDIIAENEKQQQNFLDEQKALGYVLVPLEGERFPWDKKKTQGDIVASMYADMGKENKAWGICTCGSQLAFKRALDPQTGELTDAKKLYYAKFCRARLCPMCAARLSLKHYAILSRTVDELYLRHGRDEVVPIFLTLTVKNCKAHELSAVIDGLMAGWKRLIERKVVRDNAVFGWVRTLEVTYNKTRDDFHAHIHAIGFMGKDFWRGRRAGGWAISQEQWRELWRKSARLDYDPSVDVRGVKGRNQTNALKEVAKYSVKSFDYVRSNDEKTSKKVLRVFDTALKGRRLFAMTGEVKRIAAELGLLDNEDLIHIDENAVDGSISQVEVYQWFRTARQYAMTHFGLSVEEADALLGVKSDKVGGSRDSTLDGPAGDGRAALDAPDGYEDP